MKSYFLEHPSEATFTLSLSIGRNKLDEQDIHSHYLDKREGVMLEGTLKFLTDCDTFSEKLSTRVQGTYLTTFTQISYILRVAHLCAFSCKMLLATWVDYSLIIALFALFFLDRKKISLVI